MMTMEDLAKQTEQLTIDHLAVIARGLAKPGRNLDSLTYGIATHVLRFFYGNKWTNENVFSIHRDVSRDNRTGRGFLCTDSDEPDKQARHMQRVVSLAEKTFNLQLVEGCKQRIERLKDSDLESALGELECAALLANPVLRLRFINPTGNQGDDYEAEVTTPGNRIICCEMKAKAESTELGKATLWRTLEKARKQLPREKPGMVLVRLPEVWVTQVRIKQVVNAAVEQVFRQSNRLVAVVALWEQWQSVPDGLLVVTKYTPYPNPHSDRYADDIEEMIRIMGRVQNPAWVKFQVFAANYVLPAKE